MCGIAGFVGIDDPDLLRSMTRLLTYRGPDEEGYFEDAGVGLGHRRLSIIDLSSGQQPMRSFNGEAVITYNGEIYNFPQLRAEMESAGIRFQTQSDTEIIVNLYALHGDDFVGMLNGIFAFAIWDIPRRRLLLARDHLGVKPLVYHARDGALLFASEAKSILLWSEYHPAVSPDALRQSLVYSFIPGDETLFQGISKLPPGHILIHENGRCEMRRYWSHAVPIEEDRGEQYYSEKLLDLLRDSIRGQMISDVPLGALLSGGLDSSMVVALMSQLSSRPVKTFSLGLGGPKDELRYARLVAERYKTDHHEFGWDPMQYTEVLPRVIWHLEEPMLSATLPTYYLAQAARREVTVVLIGEGSDEIFGGYRRYRLSAPGPMRMVPRSIDRGVYFWHFSSIGGSIHDGIFADTFAERFVDADPVGSFYGKFARNSGERLHNLLLYEQQYQLPDFQLLRVDRLTMAHSVEARVPYLDPRLVHFANSMPSRYKIHEGTEKRILRRAARELVPAEILGRRKQGLGTPLRAWFERGLYDIAADLLSPQNLRSRGYFNPPAVARLFRTSHSRTVHRSDIGKLFKLVMFEIWCRQFLDRQPGAFEALNLKPDQEGK